VETTGAFANLLLDSRLRSAALPAADRALATELTYGVLRWRGKLDWTLRQVADRPLEKLEAAVLDLLRLGLYQVCCLERVPAYAAVDETVRLARRVGAGRSAGYVNAVLRAAALRRPVRGDRHPDPDTDPLAYWSTLGSHPTWLAARWLARLGAAEAGKLMAANNQAPPLTVVANPLRGSPLDARSLLASRGIEAQPGRLFPWAFRVRGVGSPTELPGFSEGWWIPMDEGGLLPVAALDARPGQRVLDATAGGGGKTALIASCVAPGGEVVALDRSPRAIHRLTAAVDRLGLPAVRAMVGDAHAAEACGRYARVLLDAPCTGLGTVRRRPEIKWRRRPADLAAARRLQQGLLAGSARAVASGGLLVYSTCSLEPEETDDVIHDFLREHAEFRLDDLRGIVPGAPDLATDGVIRAWPHRHETDGFFAARLRRLD
jgi:16S rRNA (cytosine967-C5)-methyltransferase